MRRCEGVLLEGEEILLADYLVRQAVKYLQRRDAILPAGSLGLAARLAAEAGRETVAVVTARGTVPQQVSAMRGSAEAAAAVVVADCPAEMTTAQAAAGLGITPRAVRNLCHSGDLIGRRGPAGRWAISAGSVAVLAARRKGL